MGLITTQSAGFGSAKPKPDQPADPKPVTGLDYAGQPIPPNGFYNGRPEHQNPSINRQPVSAPAKPPISALQPIPPVHPLGDRTSEAKRAAIESPAHPKKPTLVRRLVRRKWSLERRAAFSAKMRALWYEKHPQEPAP